MGYYYDQNDKYCYGSFDITGRVEELNEEKRVVVLSLDNGGFARIFIPSRREFSSLNLGGIVKVSIWIYKDEIGREDGMWGCLSREDARFLLPIMSVSGVDPVRAWGILDLFLENGKTKKDLISVLQNEDADTLIKAPGISPKTAAKIINELKTYEFNEIELLDKENNPNITEALTMITSLGYTKADVDRVISDKSELFGKTVEEIVEYCIDKLQ